MNHGAAARLLRFRRSPAACLFDYGLFPEGMKLPGEIEHFFDDSPTPACIVSAEGNILSWNPALERLFPGRNLSILQVHELMLNPEVLTILTDTPSTREVHIGSSDNRRLFQISSLPN